MSNRRLPLCLVLMAMLLCSGCNEVQGLARNVQVPVSVQLSPFLIFDGYYVQLHNTSDKTLTGVSLTYYDAQGDTRTQQVGRIGSKETATVDPSEVNWTVVKHEKVAIHANGYLRRVVETNLMIDQL